MMPAISIELSLGDVIHEAVKALEVYRAKVEASFERVGEQVKGRIQSELLSGRDKNDMGLNVITGTGRASWVVTQDPGEYDIQQFVYNLDRAFYLSYHEDGAGHNPKRLDIENGEMRDYAEDRYIDEAINALNILAAA